MSYLRMLSTAAVTLLLLAVESAAQEPAATLRSYQRARATLERALAAHGLTEGSISASYTVETRGVVHARLQSPSPEPPFRVQRLEEMIWVEPESQRLAHRQSLEYPDFTFRQRVYLKGEAGARVVPWSDGAIALTEDALAAYREVYRRIPPLLLAEAQRRAASLRWLGREVIDGHEHEMISFAEEDGDLVTLYVNATDGLLARVEHLYSDPVSGDAVESATFTDYDEVDGVGFPGRMVIRRAGVVVEELDARLVGIDRGPPEDWPGELPAPQLAGEDAGADTVMELGEDVYLLKEVAGANYHVLAVGFEDYVLAVETPLSSEASAEVVARLGELFPSRPIRYAVPTHHHDDHSGGARAFMASGATIVTTPGNLDFFQRMADAERTLEPDALSRQPRPATIEVVEGGKRIFQDSNQRVEIHEVGPNPHATEHLVAYLPRQKLVFQGDLVVFSESGPIEPARPQGRMFARRLEALGLQVDRIAGVHGRVGTMEELRQAVAAAEDG